MASVVRSPRGRGAGAVHAGDEDDGWGVRKLGCSFGPGHGASTRASGGLRFVVRDGTGGAGLPAASGVTVAVWPCLPACSCRAGEGVGGVVRLPFRFV